MDNKKVYSSKAEKYAKYRWDYSSRAIQTISDIAHISDDSYVADIGAGTGILTKHFEGKVKCIFAIEPNAEMLEVAKKSLSHSSSFMPIARSAEDTALPDSSINLITVAQAIHWFDPKPTRNEFLRILKPGGWLAILQNYGTNDRLNKSISSISTEENGVIIPSLTCTSKNIGVEFYYDNDDFQRMFFPFSFQQNWEEFIGSLTSASYMPDEENLLYKNLERAARKIFDKYSVDGQLTVDGETELFIGQPVKLN
jgi:ubiquinone/menaquinone biosynthesis C-methylase UbiE